MPFNVLTGQIQTRDERLLELMKTVRLLESTIAYRTQRAAMSTKLADRYRARERASDEALLKDTLNKIGAIVSENAKRRRLPVIHI